MKGYNNPFLQQAVRDTLGLPGAFDLPVEESLGLGLQLLDVSRSPYSRFGQGLVDSQALSAGGAGVYGLCNWSPRGNAILHVQQWAITNQSAATANFIMRVGYLATVTALAAWTQITNRNMQYGQVRSVNDLLTSSCGVITGTSTTAGINAVSAPIFVSVAAGATEIYPVPEPGSALYGNDPGGTPVFSWHCATDNAAFRIGVVAREFRLPIAPPL